MIRRLLPLFLLTLVLALADAASAEAQTKSRSGRGYRARHQPASSDDVKLAPGMRLGRPLALTTDYMGRPIKPKAKLTSTPVKPKTVAATSMSARGTTSSGGQAKAKTKTKFKKIRRR
ncbi:hypothetical protein [Hymenobacter sp. CRA2]|uniref:hypothetical protein n=1 Tax=Hymenobacter sp. CRA2 TaxID=1955620 RepID=UPI00098FE6A6|nr:hypothetical protein [Hymenobacter sp. CRA2]OON68332.1 hypothetical protein B0919_14380 [Hymenobacter sp. CRA2]